MEQNKKRGEAYHEAGHVVIGVLVGKHVEFVNLDAKQEDGTPGAFVRWTAGVPPTIPLPIADAFREGVTLVAGYEAQDHFARETFENQSDWSDRADVTNTARKAGLDEKSFDNRCRKRAKEMLKEPKVRMAIELVAQKLMVEGGMIDGAILEKLVTSVAGPLRSINEAV